MKEIWRTISDWPAYQVSNLGRIKRLALPDSLGRPRKEKILKQIFHSGAMVVELYRGDGEPKQLGIHILMLIAFVGEPPEVGMFGLHKDDNPKRNILTNLRWGTRKDNAQDAIRNGRIGRGTLQALLISKANTGKRRTLKQRQIMSIVRRGKPMPPGHGASVSRALKGIKRPYMIKLNKERLWSKTARRKIAESNQRRVIL